MSKEDANGSLYLRKTNPQWLAEMLLDAVWAQPKHLPRKLQSDRPFFEVKSPQLKLPHGQFGIAGFIPWDAFGAKNEMLQWTVPIASALRSLLPTPVKLTGRHLRLPQGGVDASALALIHGTSLRLVISRIPAQCHVPFWQTARVQQYYDINSDELLVSAMLPAIRLDVTVHLPAAQTGEGHLPSSNDPAEALRQIPRALEILSRSNPNDCHPRGLAD